MRENPADFEHLLFYYWPYLFAFVDPITATTLSKVSIRNWLISSSSINSFDFELQYLIDLNRFFSNEYRDSIPQSSTTTSGIDLVTQYFFGCYPLLCRLLRDSLLRQQKCNASRSYLIHQNLCPSYVI
ncbi:unnamed protein product [Adineta steineri]|uniref:Uncharacterized protein n=1 Tax=Adineta steineri TaxID=433720 RepID=A0A819MYH2_9BILA|nr:unnamed protein product [Adineta steineri]